jgi:hypothetical protein
MTKKTARIALPAEALDDLARSGLDAHDAHLMRLSHASPSWCDENTGWERTGYRISYFDLDGAPIDGFWRVRFTDEAKPSRFAGKREEPPKYSQPLGTRPYAYFPPQVNWRALANDATQPITITEGEKKAACAAKHGIPCIGLGGVWSFRSTGREWAFLPELDQIAWEGRTVEICYDSDVMTKREVHSALVELSMRLAERDAIVNYVFLDPQPDIPKMGLDDYLVANGAAKYAALTRQHSKVSQAFQILNQRACYLVKQGAYWDFEHRVMMDWGHAKQSLSPLAFIPVTKGQKNPVTVDEPAFQRWCESPARLEAKALAYEPGNFSTITAEGNVNLWQPPTLRPKRGSAGPWLDLVKYIFREQEYVDWFLQWFAYPLQNPGTKLYQSVFVHGEGQGVGKSFVVTPICDVLYGENFTRLTNDDLHSTFNENLVNRQFALIDEIHVANNIDRRNLMSKLKDMITRERVSVNRKYERPYFVRDCTNYYITSNYQNALPLDPEDRRFFVIAAPEQPMQPSQYSFIDKHVRSESGQQAILYHLLNKIDCSDFDPKGPALKTVFREGVVTAGFNHAEEFVYRLCYEQESMLSGRVSFPLLTIDDMLRLYAQIYPHAQQYPTANALGRAINRYPDKILKREARIANTNDKYTLYCIADHDIYASKPPKVWLDHYLARKAGQQ